MINNGFLKLSYVAVLMFLLSGCANPINRVTFQRYYQSGLGAEQNGNYQVAKEQYYRALVNARIGNLEPQLHACAAYSLGRTLGILCDHDNAESLLQEALKFDKEVSGPVYMSLFELAYLKYDQSDFKQATSYFEQAIPLVDNQKFIEADPGTFIIHFSEYSNALSKIGRNEDAKNFSERAVRLAATYPNSKPKAGRTQYMLNCNKTK